MNRKQEISVQTELAYKWDAIEKHLQDNRLWYFLRNKDSESVKYFDARIEILFILYNAREGYKETSQKGPLTVNRDDLRNNYNTFVRFNRFFSKRKSAWILWKEVAGLFDILEEWYEDYTLYHLIGLRLEMVDEPLDEILCLIDKQLKGRSYLFLHGLSGVP